MIDTSIVIPVFKEDLELKPCLYELARQTHIFRCEIVIVEYNPDKSPQTVYVLRDFKERFKIPIRFIEVHERGIPLARHEGIMAARGQIICDFDADARWSRDDALQKMLDPIVEGEAVMTACPNELDMSQIPRENLKDPWLQTANPTIGVFNFIQKQTNWIFADPGTCFLIAVYEECGGFDLEHEGWETGF